MRNLPVLLVIMDGFGLDGPDTGNAILAAHTPVLDSMFEAFPWTSLEASGEAVGLPKGQMGNSEVGHLNIGSGSVVCQEITRISRAVDDGSFFKNEVLCAVMDEAQSAGKAVHLMGLVSDGGVHSLDSHIYALVDMAARRGVKDLWVHAFLDGRDTPPKSGAGHVTALEDELARAGTGKVASVAGRYYAMDRDGRWERVEQSWRAMIDGEGVRAQDAVGAIERSYADGVTDEFVVPVVVCDGERPRATIQDGDAVIFFNFRPDRARQLTRAFTEEGFSGFERASRPDTRFVCLTEYDPTIDASVAFTKGIPCCTLADVLAEAGLRQIHIAETEKYAHVTFFLNGGSEEPKVGEIRILVPSPKVATYDLQPEMSAPEVASQLMKAIRSDAAEVYIVNFANCDMVGHTGVFSAAVAAVEVVDEAVGLVLEEIHSKGGSAIITADHGNAERMLDLDGVTPFTAHSTGDVPFVVVAPGVREVLAGGKLADVAPSLLDMIGIDAPGEWTGSSLIVWDEPDRLRF